MKTTKQKISKTRLTKKKITISQFTKDLLARIENAKTIDCCKEEIKTFARLAARKIPTEMISVRWHD